MDAGWTDTNLTGPRDSRDASEDQVRALPNRPRAIPQIMEVAYACTLRRRAGPRKAKEHGVGCRTSAGDVTWTPSRMECSGWGDRLRLLTAFESLARD
jgi:hypothetical protein